MKGLKKTLALLTVLLSVHASYGQDDLLNMLNEELPKETIYTQATFKATRLINGQTMETISKNHLNFWISHRFGSVNSGFISNFFGLDEARIRLGLEYGITDRLLVGVGRSSEEKTYDFYTKYKVLRQSDVFPFTLSAYGSMALNTMATGYVMNSESQMKFYSNEERLTYTSQVLIGRKFSEKISLQLIPTFIHMNKVENTYMDNNLFSFGMGGRYKVTQRVTLSAEYYYNFVDRDGFQLATSNPYPYHNSLSVGVDIETGGHVFQLHFTNARGMVERHFIALNTGTWENADIYYGFNIARTFSLSRDK
ncbi:DUF5777 family beta-barrel protein [Algoriphagus sp. D3-2-R+10]|uniref:DUF5777 family beta-barrel protein n=1 Tax=Algoriphagus aurantiacus TaxID=3103948 RepID=UPI002B3DF7DF|nr:DUF5777 family beta-barrel protein [Algoriphagus sp. D3-2-R+10]MEB2775097.1 DUF5777 family beta-barrel protein [Algoriphagus sp. D3-2-R+10]